MNRTDVGRVLLGLRVSLSALALALAACGDDDPKAHLPQLYDLGSAPKAIQEAAAAVVRIQHPAGLSGTGSFISKDGLMLTNNHVLGGEECAREGCAITLSFDHQRGKRGPEPVDVFAVPVHVDVGLDMAILQVYRDNSAHRARLNTPDYLAFEGRDSKELIGTRVTAVGHPLGRLKKWSAGVVIDAEGSWFESTAFSLPGSSGSPMLDDDGRIVGLLHRGADGFDLLTRSGTNVSTIGTAAAALVAAMKAPLPPTVISLDDDLSAEDVLSHSDVFLAGSQLEATVDGEKTAILDLFADACDEGLARKDYPSPEDLQDGLSPCYAAVDFIECRQGLDDEPQVATTCPLSERAAWTARYRAVTERQFELNGAVDLSLVSFALQSLAANESAGDAMARDAMQEILDEAQPLYDFSLLPYLAAFGVESYAGQDTLDLVLNYKRFPYYGRSAWEISLGALWLYSNKAINRDQALGIMKALYSDRRISLGSRLRIEEILYGAGALK